jgi:hypothetical protein
MAGSHRRRTERMAGPPRNENGPQPSWLVQQLIPEGKDFPDVPLIPVAGFLGRVEQRGEEADAGVYVHLYTSLSLSEYLVIKLGDVVRHIAPPDSDEDKHLSLVVLWIKNNARVDRIQLVSDLQSSTKIEQQSFLLGDIVDSYLPQASPLGMPTLGGGQGVRALRSAVLPCSFGGCGSNISPCGDQPPTNATTPC